jgi:nucleoside 2-deoxyribosyltransferase
MIIYLAGAIRPKLDQTLEGNVAKGKAIALELWKKGYAVFSPHANSDLPISLADKEVESSKWLNGDLEILSRCDVLVVIPGWEYSDGTKDEIRFANNHGIPVYFYPQLPNICETMGFEKRLRDLELENYFIKKELDGWEMIY